MIDTAISNEIKTAIQTYINGKAPGCVCYFTKNGEPFIDASFGYARLASSPLIPDNMPISQLAMGPGVMVHTASVGKFICSVAILRLMQEWNAIFDALVKVGDYNTAKLVMPFPVEKSEEDFVNTVANYGTTSLHSGMRGLEHGFGGASGYIDLDTKIYPLVEPYLDKDLINDIIKPDFPNQFPKTYPGTRVRDITFRQLLSHSSNLFEETKEHITAGIPYSYPYSYANIRSEPLDASPAKYNLKVITTALLGLGATDYSGNTYRNSNYTVLGAIIEAITNKPYYVWVRERLFRNVPEFNFIDRKCNPPISAKYYFVDAFGNFTGGWHPDYTNFSASGGWYMTAVSFCDWVDKVMQKTSLHPYFFHLPNNPFSSNRQEVILGKPEIFYSTNLGLSNITCGKYSGIYKNGGTAIMGGTNAGIAYFEDASSNRLSMFIEINASDIDADKVRDQALNVLAKYI